MRYSLFGKSGLRVSEICLGTMTFGEEFGWGGNKEQSRGVFDAYVEAGGNFFDTANHYTKGTSERMLGEFVSGRRKDFVIATKYTLSQNAKDPNSGGNGRKNLHQSLEASLKRLGTDYVDLYWVHAWDQVTPIEEMMRALDDMVRAGKVLYVGISNAPAWVISKANTLAELRGWTPFVGLQLQYSLIERGIEREHFSLARNTDLALTAWSPLGMGVLTGKYLDRGKANDRFTINPGWGGRFLTERNQKIAAEVVKIAQEIGRTPAQVAINWVHRRLGLDVIPIIGAKSAEQLNDSLGYLQFELDAEHRKRLDEVSHIALGGLYDFLDDMLHIVHGDHLEVIQNRRATCERSSS